MTRPPLIAFGILLAGLSLLAAGPLRGAPEDTDRERLAELLAAGGRALEGGDAAQATSSFEGAVELAPDQALSWLGLSQAREMSGQTVQALEAARGARRLDRELAPAVLAVGRLLARLGLASEALEEFARFRELDPGEPQGYLLAALQLRELGRSEEALAILQQAREQGIVQPEIEAELAFRLLAAGRREEARSVAEAASTRWPERSDPRLALGLALAADPERRQQAIPWLEQALELGAPDPPRVHLELAALLLEAGRPSEAADHLRQVVKLAPDSAEAHYRLGAALRASGDLEGARAALQRFRELEQAADSGERSELEIGTALNRAQELAAQNRLPEALEAVAELLEAHPELDRAWSLHAKVLFSMGRRDEALASIIRARELSPGRVEFHYLEGMFSASLGRLTQADTALRGALALDPDRGESWRLLGAVSAELGRHQEAAEQFQLALDLGTDDAGLRLAYSRVLEQLGRNEESAQQMEAYRRQKGD